MFSWTIIRGQYLNLCDFEGYASKQNAQKISEKLGVETIYFGNSDTADCIDYSYFDSGKELETFDYAFCFSGMRQLKSGSSSLLMKPNFSYHCYNVLCLVNQYLHIHTFCVFSIFIKSSESPKSLLTMQ